MYRKGPFRIVAINLGSTSTKIAIYEDETPLYEGVKRHSYEELAKVGQNINEQHIFRYLHVRELLTTSGVDLSNLSAVVARGGLFKPVEGGVYLVNERVLQDAIVGVQGNHISNVAVLVAKDIAERYGVPCFFVDPPCVDELEPIARFSGVPELPRTSIFHALNLRAVARRVAKDKNTSVEYLNLILAHLGGGISVAASRAGRFIDVTNALEEGPFSPERAGSVPVLKLVELCYSGRFTKEEIKQRLVGKGGLVAYLGTNDISEVEKRALSGDGEAELILKAMAYQIAKEIGSMSCALSGKVDYIVLTGGIAHSTLVTASIIERVQWIAETLVYPGEEELRALVEGALRVLRGEETPKLYE